jgi:hypothetical protein
MDAMTRKTAIARITRITFVVFLVWLVMTAILLWQTVRRPAPAVAEQHNRLIAELVREVMVKPA